MCKKVWLSLHFHGNLYFSHVDKGGGYDFENVSCVG